MQGGMLQILITVWVGVHPATYTIPNRYPMTSDSCQRAVNELFRHRRRGSYKTMRIECVPAVGSLA